VVTPPTAVAVLRAGYPVGLHPSATAAGDDDTPPGRPEP
jgi:hypothetical protein